MSIKSEDVKRLRDATGAGMMDSKQALVDADGDFEKAKDLLRERGIAKAGKLSERAADEGAVISYLHQPDPNLPPKVGVLVELNCATDFVAKTARFQEIGREVAMHIAWARPMVVSRDELSQEDVDREKKLIAAQAEAEGKPAQVIEKIVEGRMKTFYEDNALLDQKWTKDDTKTIGDLLAEATAELKEPVKVRRFARFRVGAE